MKRLVAALAIANMGVTCGPGGGPPDPDVCDTPQTRTLASVELGTGNENVFTPFVDDQIVSLTYGPQGGAMLPVRLRVTGTSLPDCLGQATTIRMGAETIATSDYTLKTYAEADGSRTTRANYVIFYYEPADGAELLVTTMAGGQSATRRLYLNEMRLGAKAPVWRAPERGAAERPGEPAP